MLTPVPFTHRLRSWVRRHRLSAAILSVVLCGRLGAGWAAGEIRPAADAPQPLTPEESQRRFQLPPGFRIELVASEPMLADPTDMAFDAQGRLFVCELYGYNLEGHYDVMALNQTGELDRAVRRVLAPPAALERATREAHGTVKRLEDTDADGRMDRLTVWATNLPPCYGLVAARQGVIVLCAPDIVYLADRDDDGRADFRETLFTGFGVGEMWTRISNPHWGVDNWIYAACGDGSAGTIRGPHLPAPVQLGNTGFRFKADGTALEPVAGGTSGFGLALDDEDERFLVANQEQALYVAPLPYRYLARNPFHASPRPVLNISTYGHPAQVFPTAPPDPWRLKRSQQPEWVKFYGAAETTMGLVTAACAPLIYRADQFPAEYRGAHFSCECAYNLIHLCRLEPDGSSYRAVRALEHGEFLTSTEPWFRPVNLADGPDGALYVVDMYREIIEDYSAIPRYLQQQYGLIAGWDRGRIWRILYAPGPPADGPSHAARTRPWNASSSPSTALLLDELACRNAWRRLTAQRLLVERGDRAVVPALEHLLRHGGSGPARLHALHTLAGLAALAPERIADALGDPWPAVRRHALPLAEPWLDREPSWLDRVLRLTRDPDPKVRLQVAFTLGETRDPRRLPALAALANEFGGDRWMPAAIVTSVPDAAEPLLRALVDAPTFTAAGRLLVRPLVEVIGARRHPGEVLSLLELVSAPARDADAWFQTNCLSALIETLPRGRSPATGEFAAGAALRSLLAHGVPAVRRLTLQLAGLLKLADAPEVRAVFEEAARAAVRADSPERERKAALALLASGPWAVLAPAATQLLAAHQPLDLQLAAVSALAASDDPAAGAVLLSGWDRYSPRAQTAVLEAMFQRQDRLRTLLDALERRALPRPGFDALRRERLRTNPDPEIRRRAEVLLGGTTADPDRQVVLARYQAALEGPRDPARGRELFQVHCASCHLLEGVGKPIGPELLAATRARADDTILLDILQPSDQITVGYRTYTVVTTTGLNLAGVLAAETATSVTLPDEDGLPQTILRRDIAAMQASDVSLMPSNFDELLAPQDVAHLLGYLRHLARSGPGPVVTLFDDDQAFAHALTEGDGSAEVVAEDVHAGLRALCVTPPQRFAPRIAGWNFAIAERPEPGQFRYLRFAWKAPAARGVMLELAADGQWPAAADPRQRYYAGTNSTGWAARQLAPQPPADWTVVTVDLWRDTGAFRLTGLAPTAMGGPAWFDSIQLLRALEPEPHTPPPAP